MEAQHKLTQSIYDFIAGGAGDEYTMNRNIEAFKQIHLVPQIFRSSSDTNTTITLLNHQLSHPFMVTPSAFHSCVHPQGEIATVRAVNQMGIVMVLSTMSSIPLETVAKEATCPLWFQLYIFKDRSITQQLIQKVTAAGYTALVLTVDVPIMGNRERDKRNRFKWQASFTSTQSITSAFLAQSNVKQTTDALFASDLSWDDIEWLKAQTDLPIILKGIMHEKDAEIAINLDTAAWSFLFKGRTTLPAQNVQHNDGSYDYFFIGEVYNVVELRILLAKYSSNALTCAIPELLYLLYAFHGKQAFSLVDGPFTFIKRKAQNSILSKYWAKNINSYSKGFFNMNTIQVNALFSDENVSDVLINSLHTFWLELLDSSNIGLNDSFFYLGADSITVLKLLFRIQQQFGIRLLYKDIFENPTINLQAHLIKCKKSSYYHDGS